MRTVDHSKQLSSVLRSVVDSFPGSFTGQRYRFHLASIHRQYSFASGVPLVVTKAVWPLRRAINRIHQFLFHVGGQRLFFSLAGPTEGNCC